MKAWIALLACGALVLAITAFADGSGTTQRGAQQDTKEQNERGAQIAKLISYATIGLGVAQIYKGYKDIETGKALSKTGEGEVTAGEAANASSAGSGNGQIHDGQKHQAEGSQQVNGGTIQSIQGGMTVLQGMQGLLGAEKMQNNANAAARNMNQIDSLNPKNPNDNVKVDPSFLHDGDVGKALDKFEKTMGIPREALANSLESGKDPFDLLASKGVPKDVINAARLKAGELVANGASVDPKTLGLDPNAIARSIGAEGDLSGGGMGRSPSSELASLSNFDDLLNAAQQSPDTGIASGGVDPNKIGLSKDVQDAMNRAGRTDKTLFEMISAQYHARTLFMFGLDENQKGKDVKAPVESASNSPNFEGTF